MEEHDCQFVSSRGILKICERHNRYPQSSSRHIDEDLLDNLNDYDVIHLCSWLSISIFFSSKKWIDKLNNKKIILVTNDSDFDSPIFEKPVGKGDEIQKEDILKFLNSDQCVHWFTQNCTLEHPKVSPIPIGMDYHTFSNFFKPLEQETLLISTKPKKPFWERMIRCYCNFHFSMEGKYYSEDRISCYQKSPIELCYYEKEIISRDKTWRNQSLFAFVLSPAGGGLDCHRTWEALNLGCIPILKRYHVPYEKLFENLPVLFVNEWEDINELLLHETVKKFKFKHEANQFQYELLTLKYWKEKIFSFKQK